MMSITGNIAGIANILTVIYMTPCNSAELDYIKTMTDVMLEQHIQTGHPWEFP